MNRDHAIWLWGQVVGLAGLVLSNAFDLGALGLTDHQQHGLMAVCAVIAAVSGKLATSPLPGKP